MSVRIIVLDRERVFPEHLFAISILLAELTKHPRVLTLESLRGDLGDPDIFVLAAVDETQTIVGMATLATVKVIGRRTGRIEDVVVTAAYRRKGIGERLTDGLIAESSRRGHAHLDLTSGPDRVAANALYVKKGFELLNQKTNVYRLSLQ